MFFDAMEVFEDLFNKDNEIKKESRNRIMNIKEKNPALVEEMEKLIP